MVTFTTQEVGQMMAIVASRCEQILAEPNTDDELKAIALKCKAAVTREDTPDGNYVLTIPAFEVVGMKSRWW